MSQVFAESNLIMYLLPPEQPCCTLHKTGRQNTILRTSVTCAEYVKEAVQEDNAGNYQRAFELYKIALEYFGTHLKYEKNARARETITAKVCHALCLH